MLDFNKILLIRKSFIPPVAHPSMDEDYNRVMQWSKKSNATTYLFVTLLITGIATVTMSPKPDASR